MSRQLLTVLTRNNLAPKILCTREDPVTNLALKQSFRLCDVAKVTVNTYVYIVRSSFSALEMAISTFASRRK